MLALKVEKKTAGTDELLETKILISYGKGHPKSMALRIKPSWSPGEQYTHARNVPM